VDFGSIVAGIQSGSAYVWPSGQTDGFLPNKEELGLLFQQRSVVGGFILNSYWSSTEADTTFNQRVWYQGFWIDVQRSYNKSRTFWVRSVRAF